MDKDFRLSASTIKKAKNCWFSFYCNKVAPQTQDRDVETMYGDGGNAVHHAIEHYYNHIFYDGISEAEVVSEAKAIFELEWEKSKVGEQLDKNLYWLCVLNAIRLNLKPTHLEYQFLIDEPVAFKGYADFINQNDNFILDWKTSTYKTRKVEEYRIQLKYYAWCYYKEKAIIPECAVYFAKVGRMVRFKFTQKEIEQTEADLVALWAEIQKRIKTLDFPRNPTRSGCHFCPYKGVCATELLRKKQEVKVFKLHIHKGDKLIVEGSIPEELHQTNEEVINYKMKNAFFMIQHYLKHYGKRIDGIKRLYKRTPVGAQCYTGYLQLITDNIQAYYSGNTTIKFEILDYRDKILMNKTKENGIYTNTFELYDYQKEAVEKLLRYRWGTIEIGTGGGKTDIAAKFIVDSKASKTLFVIDNKDLLLQTKKEYTAIMPNHKVTIVGMGQRDWSGDVVLATIQTLAKHINEFKGELAKFNCVVWDECQILAAKSFEKLSKVLINTKYRAAFSATAKRDDGNTNMIYGFGGIVIYRKPALELTKLGVLTPATALFYHYNNTVYEASSEKELTDEYDSAYASEYRSNIVNNKSRNDLIVKIAKDFVTNGKQVMILCKLVDHLNMLKEQLPEAELIYGQTDDLERVDGLQRFKDGKSKILIGNISIFNKGINIKNLDILINAAANAGEVKTIQSIGRALRKFEGKQEAIYIDFMDYGEYCKASSKKRIKALTEEGYEVTII